MSGGSSLGLSSVPRLIQGRAHLTEMGGTRGLTLFPSPEVSPWPPFAGWAETVSGQSDPSEPHPHRREEIVNYVVAGTLLHVDGALHPTEIPEGSVHVMSAVGERSHDVRPKSGSEARWVSIVLHLPHEGQLNLMALELNGGTHLPAWITADDVAPSASDPATRARRPGSIDLRASCLADVEPLVPRE